MARTAGEHCRVDFGARQSQGLSNRGSVIKIVLNYLLSSNYSVLMPASTLANVAPRRRLTTAQRQREIVTTVVALARERGPDAITSQAIADRMGVTQGAVFRHYRDKEAIWLAVFAWVRESLGVAITVAIDKANSPLAKIEAAFAAHVAFIAANPGVARILFHELQYPGDSPVRANVRQMITAYRTTLARLFTQAKSAGELAADLDTTLAPILFIGAVQGLVIESSLAGGSDAAMVKRARRLFCLLLHGYRGRRKS